MSSDKDPANPTRGSLRLAPTAADVEIEKAKLPRQFVNFTFYHARPEWRLLEAADKQRCRDEFVKTVDEFRPSLLIHSYSTIGLRTNVDFMIWRIGYELDPIQEMTARLNKTEMAKYIDRLREQVGQNGLTVGSGSHRHGINAINLVVIVLLSETIDSVAFIVDPAGL